MLTATHSPAGAGLEAFFQPRSVAVIGASDDVTKIGGRPVQLLRAHGYAGDIYPVNPKGGQIQGLPAFASVRQTPQAPELAVIAVPASAALEAVRDCAEAGVRAAVVLSAGLGEAGPQGAALQAELVRVARSHGMRLLGPNCLGVVDVRQRLTGTFSIALERALPPEGPVGIVSQSGNIGSFAMQTLAQRGLGISRFIATGNEADVDVADGIAALAADPHTRVIVCCMEACRDAPRLYEALALARAAHKPVIVLKIGATEQGQAAAASHTGALTGSDAVFDAVFRRHGALRVRDFEELIDVAHAASLLGAERLPRQRAVTLVAASGGFGIMMADAMVQAGMHLPPLSEATQARIREAVPTAGTGNPVDASAQMSARPDILARMLGALLSDSGGGTLVLLLAMSLHNPRLRAVYMDALAQLRAAHPERLLVVISKGPDDALAQLQGLGIPVFASIPAAASGLDGLVRLGELVHTPPVLRPTVARAPVDAAVFRNEHLAKRALAAAGVPVPEEDLVDSADAAVASARRVGYPVVLKIASPDIAHKTEVGGVVLHLADDTAVRQAFDRLWAGVRAQCPQARLDGVLVAPMVGGGVELIAGVSRDPVFGPVVMVGLGGIHAEILKDVAVQVAPVSPQEAEAMIRGLRMFALLDGARGRPRADVAAAAEAVARLSELACRHVDGVAEIDINPLLVRPQGQGVVALDALFIPFSS